MSERYNIYFAGHILEGENPAQVRSALARLFKADDATLEKLFSGKAQLIKRGCDKSTAIKYKQAMENAGAKPLIKRLAEEAAAPQPSPTPKPAPMTTAERIAAVAAGRDPDAAHEPTAGAGDADQSSADKEPEYGLHLAPLGSDLLRQQEREVVPEVAVDIADLRLDESGARLSAPAPEAPPAPDVSHLSAAAVGETIPNLAPTTTPVSPDISAITLSPEGEALADDTSTPVENLDLDLSHLNLAAAGSDILEPAYQKQENAQAPNTDHISLSD